jgi:hypothetical protein
MQSSFSFKKSSVLTFPPELEPVTPPTGLAPVTVPGKLPFGILKLETFTVPILLGNAPLEGGVKALTPESGIPTLEGTPRLETDTVLMLVGRALLGFSREMLEVNSWVGVVLEGAGSELEG